MAKNGPDRTNAIVDQFMRIAKHAPKSPKQPVTLEEQIAYHAQLKRDKYAQEEKDRKQRALDKEIERNTPQFSGNPIGVKAKMEYEKKKRQDEANNKKK